MKNQKNSNFALVLALFAIIGLSSCNRGYGCPYDFSVMETVAQIGIKVLGILVSILF